MTVITLGRNEINVNCHWRSSWKCLESNSYGTVEELGGDQLIGRSRESRESRVANISRAERTACPRIQHGVRRWIKQESSALRVALHYGAGTQHW